MIKFKTQSGSQFTLDGNILVRIGVKPLVNVYSGLDMGEPAGEEISFTKPPTLGESFYYYHPTLYGCVSTPVVEVEEVP